MPKSMKYYICYNLSLVGRTPCSSIKKKKAKSSKVCQCPWRFSLKLHCTCITFLLQRPKWFRRAPEKGNIRRLKSHYNLSIFTTPPILQILLRPLRTFSMSNPKCESSSVSVKWLVPNEQVANNGWIIL